MDKTFYFESDTSQIISPIDYIIPLAEQQEMLQLSEAEYNRTVNKLKLEVCDVDKKVKVNNLQEVTNPVTFVRNNFPSSDGLLSNEIFGITRKEREGIFAYIDLGGLFMDPSCYKTWCRIDSRIKSIVHQTEKYIINADGDFEVSPNGKNGVKFLKDNFDKINFRTTTSSKRDLKIEYLKKNKDVMFITKYLVIPPAYRDVNSGAKNAGVGAINKMYSSLLLTIRSLKSTQDYGFDNTGAICGRIQETLVNIYDWFVGNRNPNIKEEGIGMSGKKGIIRRANRSKTADYASRLVLSANELKVETVNDLMVNLERSALPLAATIADFYPYMLFHVKKFFENELGGVTMYPVMDKNGNISYHKPKDPLIEFSDERIKKELKRFVHGFSNRFIPIEIPMEDTDAVVYMQFKGRHTKTSEIGQNPEPIYHRRLTWCDVFYQAAVESTKGMHLLITRYPIDSYFNQFTTKIIVSSTKQTEPMYIENEFYEFYPKIREEDIGKNTGNKFVDTMIICNLFLAAIGGDYDGDTVIVRGTYTVESNEELEQHMYSKKNFIDLGGGNIRVSSKDAIQSLFNLTRVLPGVNLTDPVF